MNREEIRAVFRELAKSQGAYGRIEESLSDMEAKNPKVYEDFMAHLEAQNFKDPVDLILYLEG